MQISSATRAISSAVLVSAFVFAPIGNILPRSVVLPTATIAEASAPITNNISGTVRTLATASSSSVVAEGMTVHLTLKNSGALTATAQTDAGGRFVFTAAENVDYIVSLVPAVGYGIPIGAPLNFELSNFTGVIALDGFIVEKLPTIFLYGGNTVFVKTGGTYEDPGVELRAQDGSVVRGYAVEATGSVNTKVAGEYFVTYHVDAKATGGFPTKDVVRKVIVGSPLQIAAIKPVTPAVSNEKACVLLTSYMSKDGVNSKLEVLKLQTFLFIYEGLMNVRATGVYDEATERGVRIFQDRHFPEVLSLWGKDGNTGNVYITTQKKINEIYCGHEFPLTFAQLKEIATYRVAALGQRGVSFTSTETAALAEAASTTKQGALSAWWNRTKQSLLAVMPTFGKKDDGDMISASGSVSASSEVVDPLVENKTGNIATAFYNFRSFLNMTAIAAVFALLLGVFAFAVSIYLYRRTRGEEEVVEAVAAPIVDIPTDSRKVK